MKPTSPNKSNQQDLFPGFQFSSSGPLSTPLPDLSGLTQKGRIDHMPKFKPFHEFQLPLVGLTDDSFLDYADSVIPQDHLCRLVKQVVFSLNTEAIESKYSFSGQNSYHPKIMLSLLFYGYATGVRSSRKLKEKCIGDLTYIYLMQCYQPDHRTISDFRKDNIKEIENYFVEIVRIFHKLGFTQVGKIYIDGTKVRANASSKRTKDQAGFEKWLSSVKEEIVSLVKEAEETDIQEDKSCKTEAEQELLLKKLANRNYLKDEIEKALKVMDKENRKKMNLTDSDANYMKSGGSKDIRPGYNCQAAVTEDGVILAAETEMDPNDKEQLQPMIEKTESNTGEEVTEAVADSGYGSYSNFEYLEEKEIDGYVPDGNFHQFRTGEYEKEENRYHYSNFKYDEIDDSYTCPEGKKLKFWKKRINKTPSRDWNHKVYKGVGCGNCSVRALCTKAKTRELLIELREPLLQQMRKKLMSEEGKKKYLKRQYTIEPIFGHIKYNIGYRNFLLRGVEKVNAELKLMSIGWNLKKLLKFGLSPAQI